MQNQKSTSKDKVHGEGNYAASREYNQKTADFAKSGKVDKAAKDAKKAVEGDERGELEAAEKKGKSRMKEEDPALRKQ